MSDIVREFLVESTENLDLLDRELITLEKDPGKHETMSSIFRTIHTVKGTRMPIRPRRKCLRLLDLYTPLTSGNNIPAAVTEVQNGLNQISGQRVFYGNALTQINSSESFLNQETINLSQQANSLVGANLAQVVNKFAQAQVADQATPTKVLNLPTLLDYLK